jgi:uncharacterized membrane protein YfcA
MLGLGIAILSILVISVLMSMTGRGGGNFYVPVLVACGLPMLQAATSAQCILLCTAVAAALVFQKSRMIDWKLAMVIDPPTDVMALLGGYYAHVLPGGVLKFVFAGLLVLSGFFMLRPARNKPSSDKNRLGFWHRKFGEHEYVVNLWFALPNTTVTGLVAGMVGISGGSFKVPLMVLGCGVPMRVAVGTSSAMVAATALMGLIGHSAAGDFNAFWAIPMSITAVVGGLIGGLFSLKTKQEKLKKIFAYTTLGAALFMIINAWQTFGN